MQNLLSADKDTERLVWMPQDVHVITDRESALNSLRNVYPRSSADTLSKALDTALVKEHAESIPTEKDYRRAVTHMHNSRRWEGKFDGVDVEGAIEDCRDLYKKSLQAEETYAKTMEERKDMVIAACEAGVKPSDIMESAKLSRSVYNRLRGRRDVPKTLQITAGQRKDMLHGLRINRIRIKKVSQNLATARRVRNIAIQNALDQGVGASRLARELGTRRVVINCLAVADTSDDKGKSKRG